MKKSKKILAVLLSVLMLLSSVSVLSFAARTNYRTSAQLDSLGAYSSLGSVTRLTAEERFDILADYLDTVISNANLGTKTIDASVLGKLNLDLRSINGILQSVDNVRNLTQRATAIVRNAVNGVIGIDKWTTGMSLENNEILGNDSSRNILANLVAVLAADSTVNTLNDVLVKGKRPSLPALVYNFIPIDVAQICRTVGDIGGLLETVVQVNTGRGDDTLADINAMEAEDGKVENLVDRALWKLFARPTLNSVYKENEAGQQVDENGDVITEASSDYLDTSRIVASVPKTISYREIFTRGTSGTDKVIYRHAYEGKFDLLNGGYLTEKKYTDSENKGKGAFFYVRTPVYVKDAEGVDTTEVKYYVYEKNTDHSRLTFLKKSGYLLPSIADTYKNNYTKWVNDFGIKNHTVLSILYKAIPIAYDNLATVALNGAVKQLLVKACGVPFDFMGGDYKSAETKANVAKLDASLVSGGNYAQATGAGEVFGEKGSSVYDWSAFKAFKTATDTIYIFRYKNEIYAGKKSSTNNPYIDALNLDYSFAAGDLAPFVPAFNDANNTVSNSAKGYNALLLEFNEFIKFASDKMVNWTALGGNKWQAGDNSKLEQNIVDTVKAIFTFTNSKYKVPGQAIEYLAGNNYRVDYYNLIANATNIKDVIIGGVGAILGRFMPNLMLPDASELKGQSPAAFAALVIRELVTQFLPNFKYDSLIFEDETPETESPAGSKHFGVIRKGLSHDYWEDVCLTMGVDVGMSYISKILDLGQNDGGWEGVYTEGKEYSYDEFSAESAKEWKKTVDWLIDYGLGDTNEWQWNGGALLRKYKDLGADIATDEDPFAKVENLLTGYVSDWKDFAIVDQFGRNDETHLEKLVRGSLDSVFNADLTKIIGKGTDYKATNYALALNNGQAGKGFQALRDQKDIINFALRKGVNIVNVFLEDLTGKSSFLTPVNNVNDLFTDLHNSSSQHFIDDIVFNLIGSLNHVLGTDLLDLVGKAANFFLGWKVTSQEFKAPSLGVENSAGKTFIYTKDATNNLKITNNSAGMLFKQPDGTVDKAYNVVLKSISSSSGSVAFTNNTTLAPFETVRLPISGTANNAGVYIKLTYKVMGKDGNVLADDQTAIIFTYSTGAEAWGMAANKDVDYKSWGKTHTRITYSPNTDFYYKATDKSGTPGEIISNAYSVTHTAWGYNSAYGYKSWYTAAAGSPITESQNLVGEEINPGRNTEELARSFKPIKAKAGSTVTKSGAYPLGKLKIAGTYGGRDGYPSVDQLNLGTLYYSNNAGVKAAFDEASKINWAGIDADAAGAAYTSFLNAMANGAKFVYGDVKTDPSSFTNQTTLDNTEKQIRDTYAAIKKFVKNVDKNIIKTADDAINATAVNINKTIDVADYDKTVFIRYNSARLEALKAYNAYKAPEANDFYSANNANLTGAALKTKVDAETDTNLKSFLKAALNYNKPAFNSAVENYKTPSYTDVAIKNYASLINYYGRKLAAAKLEVSDTPAFDSIQNIVSIIGTDAATLKQTYTAESVDRYMAAFAAMNRELHTYSDRFQTKYDMQCAINGLLPKSQSMKENGNYAMLEELAKFALQQIKEGKLTEANLKAGYNYKDTQKALISALGYEYADGTNTRQLFKDSAFNEISVDRKTSPVMKDYVQKRYNNLLNELVKFKLVIPISEFSRYQIRDINKAAQTFTSRMLVNIPNFDQLYENGVWKVEITKLGFATIKRSDVAGASGVAALEALKNLKTATATDVSALKNDTTSRPDKIAISTTSTVSQNTGSLNANYGKEMSKHFYALKMNCSATEPGSIYIAPYIIYKDPVTQTEKVEWMFRTVHPNFTYAKTARPFEK